MAKKKKPGDLLTDLLAAAEPDQLCPYLQRQSM
jgi:hypothetical protein